jgi:hypothetical protein
MLFVIHTCRFPVPTVVGLEQFAQGNCNSIASSETNCAAIRRAGFNGSVLAKPPRRHRARLAEALVAPEAILKGRRWRAGLAVEEAESFPPCIASSRPSMSISPVGPPSIWSMLFAKRLSRSPDAAS